MTASLALAAARLRLAAALAFFDRPEFNRDDATRYSDLVFDDAEASEYDNAMVELQAARDALTALGG